MYYIHRYVRDKTVGIVECELLKKKKNLRCPGKYDEIPTFDFYVLCFYFYFIFYIFVCPCLFIYYAQVFFLYYSGSELFVN